MGNPQDLLAIVTFQGKNFQGTTSPSSLCREGSLCHFPHPKVTGQMPLAPVEYHGGVSTHAQQGLSDMAEASLCVWDSPSL